MEIRRAKAKFLDHCSQEEEAEGADTALKEVSFLDFDLDEYTKEVGEELLMLFIEIVARCREAVVGLEVLRRLNAVADRFHVSWEEREVKLASQVVVKAIGPPHRKRSKLYQSGMATLKNLSQYKNFRENKLNKIPLDAIKGFRSGRDDVDAPSPKRLCMEEEEMSEEDKYQKLMEDLASSTDTHQMLNIESQLEEMGYEPNIQ